MPRIEQMYKLLWSVASGHSPMARVLFACLFCFAQMHAQLYRVEDVAGQSRAKEGPGRSILVGRPASIVAGPAGTFYYSDFGLGLVRRLDADNRVTNIATIINPWGLALDAARNRLYVAQQAAGKIMMVDLATRQVTLFAGTGVLKYAAGSEGRPAAQFQMDPSFLATDENGNLFVSDEPNRRIYRIDAVNQTVRTVAGPGPPSPPFMVDLTYEYTQATTIQISPQQLAVSGNELIFIDKFNLVGVDLATGIYHTIVRGRLQLSEFQGESIFTPPAGQPVFRGRQILALSPIPAYIYGFTFSDSISLFQWAGIQLRSEQLYNPRGIANAMAESGGRLLIDNRYANFDEGAGQGNNRYDIRQVTGPSGSQTIAGWAVEDPDKQKPFESFYAPVAITTNRAGEIVFSDYVRGGLQIIRPDGQEIRRRALPFLISASAPTGTGEQIFVGWARTGGSVAVARGAVLCRFRADETTIDFLDSFANLRSPSGVAILPDQTILVSDQARNQILRFSADGKTVTTVAGNGTSAFIPGAAPLRTGMVPGNMAVGPDGIVYIADWLNWYIYRFDPARQTISILAGTGPGLSGSLAENIPATQALLVFPKGVGVNAQGEVFIGTPNSIRKVGLDGRIRTIAGTGAPGPPVAINPTNGLTVTADGSIYFADSSDFVRRLVPLTAATPTPRIASGGVVSLAAGAPRVAPGSLFSIYGSELARTTVASSALPLPMSLGGVRVRVNGQQVPLHYVSPGQINAQIPMAVLPSSVEVEVLREDNPGDIQVSAKQAVAVTSAAPDILVSSGNRAVAVHPNGTLNGPGNPATPGDTLVVYLTGLGPTTPPVVSGQPTPSNPLSRVVGTHAISIGGVAARIDYLGLTPGFAGLAQANIQVPPLESGDYDLLIEVRGFRSNSVKLAVRQ